MKRNASLDIIRGFAAAFWERWRGYKLPFIATLLFGLAAHAFAMTNKLPFDDEAIYLLQGYDHRVRALRA